MSKGDRGKCGYRVGISTAKFALMKVSKISHQNRNTPTNLPSHTHSVLLETPLIYHFFSEF